MKNTYVTVIAVSLLSAAGCMHTEKQGSSAGTEYGSNAVFSSANAKPTAPPEAEETLNNVERADKLIGEQVLTSDNLRTGKIDDFVIDQSSGRILYAIVGIGGVLGVGETKVAVPPALFTEAKKGEVQLTVDKHKLTRAPQLPSQAEQMRKPDFISNVYGYYGQPATWQKESATAAAGFDGARKASELIGMTVQNDARQDIGKVESIVLNVPKGREVYVVIAPSAAMNLGNNYYALPPKVVKLSADQKTLLADVTRDKLSNAPRFAKDDWSELSDSAWGHKVYQYYGETATFQRSNLQPTGRTFDNGQAPAKR